LAWRSRWNTDHPDLRLSLNDVFVRAAALALGDVPAVNVRYSNGVVEQRTGRDLLLVVAAGGGLSLVPICDPVSLSWEDYAVEIRHTLKRAGQGRAAPSLLEGAPALAVSNLGMFGVRQFTAIIPPGSTAILAIGAVREEAVVRNRGVEVGEVCALTLASDHRVVDGIAAAKFLERIQVHLRAL
ncbi:MAG TPA: 2-oxo acid dehydrogenase subunit E2, partial [Terriglobales bacterium]